MQDPNLPLTAEELDQEFPTEKLRTLPKAGNQIYVQWQDLVSMLNHRFGPNGWTSKVDRNVLVMNEIRESQRQNDRGPQLRRLCAAEAHCTLTVFPGTPQEITRSASASTSADELYSRSEGIGAVDRALKSTATNAFKRAAAMLGRQWSPAAGQKAGISPQTQGQANSGGDFDFIGNAAPVQQQVATAPVPPPAPANPQNPQNPPGSPVHAATAPAPDAGWQAPPGQMDALNTQESASPAISGTTQPPATQVELPKLIQERHESILDTARSAGSPALVHQLLESEKERLRAVWAQYPEEVQNRIVQSLEALKTELDTIAEQIAMREAI